MDTLYEVISTDTKTGAVCIARDAYFSSRDGADQYADALGAQERNVTWRARCKFSVRAVDPATIPPGSRIVER